MKNKDRVAFLPIVLILFVLGCSFISGATAATLQQIKETESKQQEITEKQNQTDQKIDSLKSEQKTLKGKLNELNTQLTEVADRLAQLEEDISAKENEISVAEMNLENAIATENWQYESMVKRVRMMYEQNDTSYLNAILGAGSISELVSTADYLGRIEKYDKKKLSEFKENHRLIEEEKARLEQERVELEGLKTEAETEHSKVSGLIGQTRTSIAGYSNEISENEKQALAYEEEQKKLEEDLAYLKKKLEEEIAMSRRAASSSWRDISEVSFDEGDRYLLANLIYCEAGAEPYDGKVAVGAVVINRVLSSVYPDTVTGVIYQKYQFSPVGSGRLALALAENRATKSCYEAADEAMTGFTNVGACVYFRTPIEGLTGISIGGHIFY